MYRATVLAAALLFSLMSSSAAAPVVILSGSVGGQGPGGILDDSAQISLAAGETLMFNDAAGQTRVIAGPYQGAIGAGVTAAKELTSLERLVASKDAEQSRLGAIRAAPRQEPRDPDLISIAHSSEQCIRSGEDVVLWRPETLNADSALSIMHEASGASAKALWRHGAETMIWPSGVPLISGARYKVRLDIAPRAIELTLHVADPALTSETELAAWMSDVGCRRQALAKLSLISG